MVVISLIFTVQLSVFYLGIGRTNASRATLLANLHPFFVLFLAHFFVKNDRITPRKIFGMLLGFSGVVFVFLESAGISSGFRLGDGLVVLSALIWAANVVVVKRVTHLFRAFHLVFYPMVIAAPIMAVAGFLSDEAMIARLDMPIVAAMAYQSLVTASFGFVAWNALLQQYGAVALHSFMFIMPISGVVLGGLLLREPITLKILIALSLIVSGIFVVHFRQKPQVPVLPMGKNI